MILKENAVPNFQTVVLISRKRLPGKAFSLNTEGCSSKTVALLFPIFWELPNILGVQGDALKLFK
jgi:hypothetical protein